MTEEIAVPEEVAVPETVVPWDTRKDTQEAALRVSGSSEVDAVAGAIANALYEDREVSVRSIGAGAANQAIKGIIKARSYVALRGWDLLVRPGMETVTFEDDGRGRGPQERSVIVLKCVVVS